MLTALVLLELECIITSILINNVNNNPHCKATILINKRDTKVGLGTSKKVSVVRAGFELQGAALKF